MVKPQQPELRRSGNIPALDPNATESVLEAHDRPETSGDTGNVPVEQRPGHHPETEQDKPDLGAFAERLGVRAEGDEPRDAPNVTDAPNVGRSRWQSQWKRALVPAAIAVGLVALGARRARRN